jgi:DNA-binding NtrC family response regulator
MRVTTTSLTHVELAHGGIAFLDELGDMASQMQLKRLQAVEEKCCRRLGEVSDGAAGLDRPAGLAGWRGRSPIG